jgi:hypothetical protein
VSFLWDKWERHDVRCQTSLTDNSKVIFSVVEQLYCFSEQVTLFGVPFHFNIWLFFDDLNIVYYFLSYENSWNKYSLENLVGVCFLQVVEPSIFPFFAGLVPSISWFTINLIIGRSPCVITMMILFPVTFWAYTYLMPCLV